MSDVFDVVTKLSYEVVGADGIMKTADDLRKQSDSVARLEAQLKTLNDAYAKASSEGNVKRQEVFQRSIDKTTNAIAAQNKAIKDTIANNRPLQQAMAGEIVQLDKLVTKLQAIEKLRNRATVNPNVAKLYDAKIAEIKEQINQLTSLEKTIGDEKSGGVLATLFGGFKTDGAAALRGVLGGLGIGAGFGLITPIVSALTELAVVELSATKRSEELLKANDALTGSFKELGESVVNYTDAQRQADIYFKKSFETTTDGIRRQEDSIKALGVVKGEVFKAEQAQFEASQKTRQSELTDITRDETTLKRFRNTIQDIRLIGGENPNNNILNRIFPDKEKVKNAKDIIAELSKANLPAKDFEKIKNALLDASKTTASFSTVLAEVNRDLDVQLTQQEQKRLDKAKEISNAQIQRNSEIEQKRYEKSLELSLRVKKSEDELRLSKEQLDIESIDKITKDTEAKYRLLRDALIKEQEKYTKEVGSLTKEELDNFNQLFADNDEKLLQEFANKAAEFEQSQLDRRRQADINLKQGQSNISSFNAAYSLPDYGKLTKALDDQTEVRKEAQRQQFIELAKGITDSTQLQEAHEQQDLKLEQIDKDAYRSRLNLASLYYEQLAKIITDQSALIAERAETDIINRGGSTKNVGRRVTKINDRIALERDARNALLAQRAVNESNAAIDSATSDERRHVATQRNIEDQKKLADIENDQAKKERELLEIRRQENVEKIQAFQSFVQTVVDGYNTIADARQKDLDREISTREQRVDIAFKLAERGNTQALEMEQKSLEKAQELRRKNAMQQQEINAALTVSNSILAVAQAAATGVGAIVLIPLILAALGTGFSQAIALSNSSKAQFDKGGYTGDGGKYDPAGTVHRGEFVFTKERTAQYRPLFEAIHRGDEIVPRGTERGGYADISELSRKLDGVIEAVNGKTVNVSQRMDRQGLSQGVVEYVNKQRMRFK